MPTSDEILNFSLAIEKHATLSRLTIIDAIVDFCEKNDLEIETASSLLNETLKQKIRLEAQQLNLLAKVSTLPL